MMSPEKKKNVDIVGLSRLIGNFCFVLLAIIFVAGFLILIGKASMTGIVTIDCGFHYYWQYMFRDKHLKLYKIISRNIYLHF